MSRGYSVVALQGAKTPANIGGALRAAQIYSAALVVVAGGRYKRASTDTMKAYRHLPLLEAADSVFECIPFDCVPVAVDLVADAMALPLYEHPERAFYIFGGEDQTLGKKVLDRCRDRVMIPTRACMNLAACVNVVLYDRMMKRKEWEW